MSDLYHAKRAQFKVQSQSFVRMFHVGYKEKITCENAHDTALASLLTYANEFINVPKRASLTYIHASDCTRNTVTAMQDFNFNYRGTKC